VCALLLTCALGYPVPDDIEPSPSSGPGYHRRISNIKDFIKRIQNRNLAESSRAQERNHRTMNRLRKAIGRLKKYEQWKNIEIDPDNLHEILEALQRPALPWQELEEPILRKKLDREGPISAEDFPEPPKTKLCRRKRSFNFDQLPSAQDRGHFSSKGSFQLPAAFKNFLEQMSPPAKAPTASALELEFSDLALDLGNPGLHLSVEDNPAFYRSSEAPLPSGLGAYEDQVGVDTLPI
jgi:hypothetical protein